MKVAILGSGLIGLLAKEVFEGATIIPFGKSRFYHFLPPLADDFIVCHEDIDPFMQVLQPGPQILRRRAISAGGMLARDGIALQAYLQRIYDDAPAYAQNLIKMDITTYSLSCHNLYGKLLEKRVDELRRMVSLYGSVTDIKPGAIQLEHGTIEYDAIISTIPLDVLLKLTGIYQELKGHDVHYFHVRTNGLDFEGADQVLVADSPISFYKVDKIGTYDYVFHNLGPIETPQTFFQAFVSARNVIVCGSTKIANAIPRSPHAPKIQELADLKISPVGSCAQWDDFMDVSSSILRLLHLRK